MTFNEVQRLTDVKLLQKLKEYYIIRASFLKEKSTTIERDALEYCSLCDTVDRLHWRIKELSDG